MALAGKTNEAKYLLIHSLASYHTGTFVIPNQKNSYILNIAYIQIHIKYQNIIRYTVNENRIHTSLLLYIDIRYP